MGAGTGREPALGARGAGTGNHTGVGAGAGAGTGAEVLWGAKRGAAVLVKLVSDRGRGAVAERRGRSRSGGGGGSGGSGAAAVGTGEWHGRHGRCDNRRVGLVLRFEAGALQAAVAALLRELGLPTAHAGQARGGLHNSGEKKWYADKYAEFLGAVRARQRGDESGAQTERSAQRGLCHWGGGLGDYD